jgi:hypothetical protein
MEMRGMRDQYAGDISDVLKFAFLGTLAGTDRRLGIAWYYLSGDDGRPDGRWRALTGHIFLFRVSDGLRLLVPTTS